MIEGAVILMFGMIIGFIIGAKPLSCHQKEEDKPKPFDDYRDPISGRLKRPKKG